MIDPPLTDAERTALWTAIGLGSRLDGSDSDLYAVVVRLKAAAWEEGKRAGIRSHEILGGHLPVNPYRSGTTANTGARP